MSADPDKDTACPKADKVVAGTALAEGDNCQEVSEKKRKKPPRSVRFPDDNQLVTKYFEPANPWHDVPTTSRAQLAAEYLEACRRHNTTPIDSVLQQIRELPENSIGGGNRAARLALTACSLVGAAPADALEALLRKVQFRRIEVEHAEMDDEGAEAIFDMIEYYESANVLCISGPGQFGIRGWQAACRMIKKSAELSEVEVVESALCASHAPVLVRALRPHTCRLRALCLQRASLQGDPLLCLVLALKSNSSIRELRLPDNQLSVSDAQQLGSLLRFNLNIQLLDLSNNQIQDSGAGHIADALVEQAAQTPPSAATSPLSPHHYPLGGYEARIGLAFLVLWNNQLTRHCAPHLSKALRSSQSLCVLNIGRNALGTDTVRALQCGGALVSLGLQCARLGPEAAKPLADLVRADTKLQRLDLRDNKLGVAGLQAILNAMKENSTLTQIDLDDPVESTTLTAEDNEAATVARLTRDIAAICRRNEPPATEPERRVHRKISLTCHTACVAKTTSPPGETSRRTARLRSPAPSPAPSPAGSPVPHNQHGSRFSVTRVTPERESPPGSARAPAPRAARCPAASRFKVVQVAEPPKIQVHPATKSRPPSRFSVTRNYDAMYNPSPSGSPSSSPSPSVSPVPSASPLGASVSPTLGFSVSPTPEPDSPTPLNIIPTGVTDSPTQMTVSTEVTVSPTPVTVLPTEVTVSPTPVTVLPTEVTASLTPLTVLPTEVSVATGASISSAPVTVLPTGVNVSPALMSVLPTEVNVSPTPLTVLPTEVSVATGASISSAPVTVLPTGVTVSPAPVTVLATGRTLSPTPMTVLPTEVSVSTGVKISPAPVAVLPTGVTVLPTPVTVLPTEVSVSTGMYDLPAPVTLPTGVTALPTPMTVLPAEVRISTTPMNVPPTPRTVLPIEVAVLPTPVTVLPTGVEISSTESVSQTPEVYDSPLAISVSQVITSLSATVQTCVSPSLGVVTTKSPALTCESPKLTSVSPAAAVLPSSVSLMTESSASKAPDFTSGVKTTVTPSLTVVPSVCEITGLCARIINRNDPWTSQKVCNKDIPSAIGSVDNSRDSVALEAIWKNDAVIEGGDIATILSGTPSIITMIGTAISGTSIDTLSGTTSSEISANESQDEGTDSIVNIKEKPLEISKESQSDCLLKREASTDVGQSLSNVGVRSSPISIDRPHFEPRFATVAMPQSVIASQVVPTRFNTSPIPDDISKSPHERDVKHKEQVAFAIGSQTNVANASTQINKSAHEADIFTKIAEITETIAPKVVETEPKDIPKIIDLEKERMQNINENLTITGLLTGSSRIIRDEVNATHIATINPAFIDVSSNTGLKKQENIDLATTVTESHKKQILPIEYKSAMTNTCDITKFTEQAKTEGPCIDMNIIPEDSKQTEIPVPSKESINNKEIIDRTGLKSILKDLRTAETKTDVTRNIAKETIIEEKRLEDEVASNLGDKSTETCIPDIKKDISDESDVSAQNKTYSDVVRSDPKYKHKSEQLTHKEEISDSAVKTETKIVKNSVEMSESDKIDIKIEVTVKKESVQDAAKVHSDQNKDFVNIDDIIVKKDGRTIKQIEAITEGLGNLIQEMRDMSSKNRKVKSECTVDIDSVDTNKVPGNFNRDVVLKKNKSESSLDSPDLEVSRFMNKKLVGSPFCDSSSSLEISGSSMESLNAIEQQQALSCQVINFAPKPIVIQESVESDTELDRRKDVALSTESSIESTSEVPVNSGNFLNMSVSSNESVSPIIFGKKKKLHDSLSSLEASMSSLDSGRQEKVMVTSADSGIEYSLQHPSENKDDNSSNEGTLTHNSSLRETVKKTEQETLTSSPKRASSLLDVPALKTKGLDRMRKISWVAPSSSFHIPRVDTEKLEKPSHLEKLLSLFQHPTSLFSRSSDEERKSASNTPPRKDSSLTSSFWSWGSTIEKEKDDKEDSSEATDSTLSERVQVSFVDESFSKKLDSKTPSTDTDNTLSEFQSFPTQASTEEKDKVTENTTDENIVQTCLDLSLNTDKTGSNGNRDAPRASDTTDLNIPNDMNRNEAASDSNRNDAVDIENKSKINKDDSKEEAKLEPIRPRSFAAVLKSSGSENSLDKQPSPDSGQLVDKLPSKVIRGIKENISPENTLTSSMTNTKTLAFELTERQIKSQAIVNTVWEVPNPVLDKSEPKTEEVKTHSDLAPIATIEETCDEAADNTVDIRLEFIDDVKTDERDVSIDSGVTLEEKDKVVTRELENVDLGKDALSYLIYESQDFEPDTEHTLVARTKVEEGSLAQELKEAEIKEMLDLSPELVIDEATEVPEIFIAKEIKGMKSSPVIPERAKIKKSNSLEDLSQRSDENAKIIPKTKTIAFKVPETSPCAIPERRTKLRTMSGSSPKSLPESLNKPSPLTKIDSALKKRKKVSSLGKMAKDSLLALNMSEDEIAEYRRSYVTSVESLRSLESVSEDANSQSGTSVDSRCRSCLRTSQESLMSLDSITEDCKCGSDCERRSAR